MTKKVQNILIFYFKSKKQYLSGKLRENVQQEKAEERILIS